MSAFFKFSGAKYFGPDFKPPPPLEKILRTPLTTTTTKTINLPGLCPVLIFQIHDSAQHHVGHGPHTPLEVI